MQTRNAIAVSLSVLLLCVSSLAAMCDLSCSLPVAHHASHSVGRHATDAVMSHAGMTMGSGHCSGAMQSQASGNGALRFEATSSCDAAPCTQAQIVSFPASVPGSEHSGAAVVAQAVTVSAFDPSHPASDGVNAVRLRQEPPPVDLVATALRI